MHKTSDDQSAGHVPTRYQDPSRGLTLHNEDSLIGMHEFLAPGSVDVIVTSPPFNIAKNYSRYNDAIPRGQYLDWLEDWGQEAKRVLADDGSLFLNLGGTPKSPHGPHEVLNRLRRHFVLQNEIHIISSIVIDAATVHHRLGRNRDLVVGHHKPINSDRYLHKGHEYLYHFTARGTVPLDRLAIGTAYQDKSNVARWSGRRDRPLSRQRVGHSLPDDPEPGHRPAASRVISCRTAASVYSPPRRLAHSSRARPVRRDRHDGARLPRTRCGIRGVRDRLPPHRRPSPAAG